MCDLIQCLRWPSDKTAPNLKRIEEKTKLTTTACRKLVASTIEAGLRVPTHKQLFSAPTESYVVSCGCVMHPLVSVLMKSRDHERFIAEAIESVLQQDFEDLELIMSLNIFER